MLTNILQAGKLNDTLSLLNTTLRENDFSPNTPHHEDDPKKMLSLILLCDHADLQS